MTNSFQTRMDVRSVSPCTACAQANAPRLALIHSLALDRTIWDGVAEELEGEAHLLAYDCRGHGKSGNSGKPYAVEQFANDLAELLDHVGWPSAAVAGCSLGGCVAQAFGGLHPQRAAALGLIDTTAWYGADAPRQWRDRAAKAQAGGLGEMVDFQISRWFSDKFRAQRPDLVEAATRVFLATDLEAYASTCVLLGDADVRRFHAGLKMPVAVIVGEEDYATPVAMARQIHESVPGSTLEILAAARHLTPIERPDRIAAELRALLVQMAAVS